MKSIIRFGSFIILAVILFCLIRLLYRPSSPASAPNPPEVARTTPNEFYGRGTPTFIIGTLGDHRVERDVSAQVDLIRGLLFPNAPIVKDEAIEASKGPTAWPPNPVVFGGPHVNSLLAKLSGSLPFSMERDNLRLGDQVFEGDEYRLIAVIPSFRHGRLMPKALATPSSCSMPGLGCQAWLKSMRLIMARNRF